MGRVSTRYSHSHLVYSLADPVSLATCGGRSLLVVCSSVSACMATMLILGEEERGRGEVGGGAAVVGALTSTKYKVLGSTSVVGQHIVPSSS